MGAIRNCLIFFTHVEFVSITFNVTLADNSRLEMGEGLQNDKLLEKALLDYLENLPEQVNFLIDLSLSIFMHF